LAGLVSVANPIGYGFNEDKKRIAVVCACAVFMGLLLAAIEVEFISKGLTALFPVLA